MTLTFGLGAGSEGKIWWKMIFLMSQTKIRENEPILTHIVSDDFVLYTPRVFFPILTGMDAMG